MFRSCKRDVFKITLFVRTFVQLTRLATVAPRATCFHTILLPPILGVAKQFELFHRYRTHFYN